MLRSVSKWFLCLHFIWFASLLWWVLTAESYIFSFLPLLLVCKPKKTGRQWLGQCVRPLQDECNLQLCDQMPQTHPQTRRETISNGVIGTQTWVYSAYGNNMVSQIFIVRPVFLVLPVWMIGLHFLLLLLLWPCHLNLRQWVHFVSSGSFWLCWVVSEILKEVSSEKEIHKWIIICCIWPTILCYLKNNRFKHFLRGCTAYTAGLLTITLSPRSINIYQCSIFGQTG